MRWQPTVVVIEIGDDGSAGGGQADVAGTGGMAVTGGAQQGDPGVPGGGPPYVVVGVVGAAVGHDQQLPVGDALRLDRFDGVQDGP